MEEGQVVGGKYKVSRELSRGGMGSVVLATHEGPEGFAREVVIKTLLPALSDREDLVQMFLNEARLAAQLTHPNIVHVYDFGKEGDTYFLVMEYLRGATLAALLRRAAREGRPLSSSFIAAVGAQVCAGLAYAHTKHGPDGQPLCVVHRDISPQNILLAEEGVAKILDFGIAKAHLGESRTRAGELKGKPSYMSPEQARGLPVDARSDVFSLGIVLWEGLAGRKLFPGGNPLELVQKICEEPIPPIGSIAAGIPLELSAAIDRALERDLDRRFQGSADMGRALDNVFYGMGGHSYEEEILAELSDKPRLGAGVIDTPASRPAGESLQAWIPGWDGGGTPSFSESSAPLELDRREPTEATASVAVESWAAPQAAPAMNAGMASRAARFEPSKPHTPTAAGSARVATTSRGPRHLLSVAVAAAVLLGAGVGGLVFLKGGDGAERGAPVREVSKWVEDLKTVNAQISSVPNGAAIWIDGADSGKKTPATIALDTGKDHTITLRHPDFLENATSVFVAPNTPLNLEPLLTPGARVEVTTVPPGATVLLDGVPQFRTPGQTPALPKGKHQLVLQLEGYVVERRELELTDAQPLRFSFDLAKGAELAVKSTPANAVILIDGKDTGQVTPAVVAVPPGKRRTVGVAKAGFLAQSRTLARVKEGRLQPLEFRLENAQRAEINGRLANLEKEMADWEKRLEALEKRRSGFVITGSVQQEIVLEREIETAEKHIEDLSADISTLRDDLARVVDP